MLHHYTGKTVGDENLQAITQLHYRRGISQADTLPVSWLDRT